MAPGLMRILGGCAAATILAGCSTTPYARSSAAAPVADVLPNLRSSGDSDTSLTLGTMHYGRSLHRGVAHPGDF